MTKITSILNSVRSSLSKTILCSIDIIMKRCSMNIGIAKPFARIPDLECIQKFIWTFLKLKFPSFFCSPRPSPKLTLILWHGFLPLLAFYAKLLFTKFHLRLLHHTYHSLYNTPSKPKHQICFQYYASISLRRT